MRVARALAALPLISQAMRHGEVSYSKVRALTRVAAPANEAELLTFAKAGTAAHVEKLVRAWRRVDRLAEAEREQRRHASRYLTFHTDEDGMVVLQARLAPEPGAALLRALDAAAAKLYDATKEQRAEAETGDGVSAEQRRADALGLVAESALTGGLDPGSRGDRYQVVVHIDESALAADGGTGTAAFEDGAHVSAETSRRLTCDSSLVVMRHDASGNVLDVGRRTRTVSPAMQRALAYRDRGCRFPGCALKLCDAHHVQHWADGGKTRLGNLVLLCRRHHRAVHEEGFRIEADPRGELRFLRPDGRPVLGSPPTPALARDPVASLVSHLESRGVTIEARRTLPSWSGGPVELGWAIDYLRPLGSPPDVNNGDPG